MSETEKCTSGRFFFEVLPNISVCHLALSLPPTVAAKDLRISLTQQSAIFGDSTINFGKYEVDLERFTQPQVQGSEIHLRLPLKHGPCDKLLYEAGVNRQRQYVEDLKTSRCKSFHCSRCYRRLCPAGVSIEKVLPMPSEGWDEFVDILSCADDMDGKKWRVGNTRGACLVGDTYILLHEDDVDNERLTDDTSSEASEPHVPKSTTIPVSCSCCRHPLGIRLPRKQQIKLFQYAVIQDIMVSPTGTISPMNQVTRAEHATCVLLSNSRLKTCRKFVVSSSNTQHRSTRSALLVWIMNESVQIVAGQYRSLQQKATTSNCFAPTQGVKVLYTVDPDIISRSWAKDPAVDDLDLEPDLVSSLHLALAHSTTTIPPSKRMMQGLSAGYLLL
eukprot:m.180641 g.180641  ORF g.180641 m.180641 type:complete len:388 (+) comp32031_c0_seq1:284-1447(+)